MSETNGRFTAGQRVTYSVPPGVFGGRHERLVLEGEVIVADFDRELSFRPDPRHIPTLVRLGFDEEDMHHNGFYISEESDRLGITVEPV